MTKENPTHQVVQNWFAIPLNGAGDVPARSKQLTTAGHGMPTKTARGSKNSRPELRRSSPAFYWLTTAEVDDKD